MNADKIRDKYLGYFTNAPRNHKVVSPAPLILQEDPTTLFTSSGMQPLVSYLMGEEHPQGKRLVNSQPCIRTVDVDEVGDNRHLTFFEMLGNWSLGDYFKKEQLAWFFYFLTEELGFSKERLWVTVFEGNKEVPRDLESAEIWKSLGIPERKILYYGPEWNWWSRSGAPYNMPPGEIGGPDSEVFFEHINVKHNPVFGKKCHPNCNCGRFVEVGNSVFIQYEKQKDGSLKELPKKNVDFGGGFERIVATVNGTNDIYKTELFLGEIREIEKISEKNYSDNEETFRIIADHLKASVFLAANGIVPSNKEHGYVLRRLLRRSAVKFRSLKGCVDVNDFRKIIGSVAKIYKGSFFTDLEVSAVEKTISEEIDKFKDTLERGLKEVKKIDKIDAKKAFDLYQSYGFPLEITEELFLEKNQNIDRKKFVEEFKKHKKLSRESSSKKFKGGLADSSGEVTRLHTTTHLLHSTLRKVLGENVRQKGSNITAERLRFDFSHFRKLTEEEVKTIEKTINEQIDKDLPVKWEAVTHQEAIKAGALAFFKDKYEDKVRVYTIGNSETDFFSKEVCGGPHVSSTGEIRRVKIKKQDKIGAGLVRVYVVFDKNGKS